VHADVLVIATDVPAAVLRYGTPEAEPVGRVSVEEMRALAAQGHFASGSMGPKVDAACRFVEQGGQYAVITNLDQIVDAVSGPPGTVGTVVVPNREEANA
jgi:carbamate kinase